MDESIEESNRIFYGIEKPASQEGFDAQASQWTWATEEDESPPTPVTRKRKQEQVQPTLANNASSEDNDFAELEAMLASQPNEAPPVNIRTEFVNNDLDSEQSVLASNDADNLPDSRPNEVETKEPGTETDDGDVNSSSDEENITEMKAGVNFSNQEDTVTEDGSTVDADEVSTNSSSNNSRKRSCVEAPAELVDQSTQVNKYQDASGQWLFCDRCGETPCSFANIGEAVIDRANKQYTPGAVSNEQMRKVCYKVFISMKYGRLGKGNRIQLPPCVLEEIRKQWPSETYMGHRDS